MAKLKEKLWNWGHLEGSHNKCLNVECRMTPEEFANVYDIKNAFIVSYSGNITPPFKNLANRFHSLNKIKWSVLGDASTPLPSDELGHTPDVINAANQVKNINGAVVDDFFSPERIKRFTPEILKKMKKELNKNGLDFWCVLYSHEFELPIEDYIDCFDGITFWVWKCCDIAHANEYIKKLKSITKDKPVMPGIYLWDYEQNKEMDIMLFKKQLSLYFDLLKSKQIEGIIFCSSTIGDLDLKTNSYVKEFVKKYGNIEIQ